MVKLRGIVQRLVRRSPKPETVVRFHVPLPSKKGQPRRWPFLLGYRLQATGYRLQATGYRLQATGYGQLGDGLWIALARHQTVVRTRGAEQKSYLFAFLNATQ